MSDPLQIEYVEEKARQAFEKIGPCLAPIFLIPHREAGPREISHSATAGLLNFGEKKLVVTCSHVWQEYEKQRSENPNVTLCIATGNLQNCIILNDAQLLDSGGEDLDLAILEPVNASLIESMGKQFYKNSHWPHRKVEVGEPIWFIGYPGKLREPIHNRVVFNAELIVDFAHSVSDRHFVLVDYDIGRVRQDFIPGFPQLGFLGGISGSPAFVNRYNKLDLVGFVYESSEEGRNATIFITHAAFIKEDGTLDRSAMPWL